MANIWKFFPPTTFFLAFVIFITFCEYSFAFCCSFDSSCNAELGQYFLSFIKYPHKQMLEGFDTKSPKKFQLISCFDFQNINEISKFPLVDPYTFLMMSQRPFFWKKISLISFHPGGFVYDKCVHESCFKGQ